VKRVNSDSSGDNEGHSETSVAKGQILLCVANGESLRR